MAAESLAASTPRRQAAIVVAGGGGRGIGGRNDSVRAQAEQHRVRHQQCCPLHHRHHATPPVAAVSVAQQPAPPPAAAVGQVRRQAAIVVAGGGGRGMGGRNDSVRAQAEQHRVRHQQCCPLHHRHHATPPVAAVSIAQQPAPPPAAAVGQVRRQAAIVVAGGGGRGMGGRNDSVRAQAELHRVRHQQCCPLHHRRHATPPVAAVSIAQQPAPPPAAAVGQVRRQAAIVVAGGGGRGIGGRNDSVRAQAEQHRVRYQQCCPLHHRHHATPPVAAVSVAQQPAPPPAAAVGQVRRQAATVVAGGGGRGMGGRNDSVRSQAELHRVRHQQCCPLHHRHHATPTVAAVSIAQQLAPPPAAAGEQVRRQAAIVVAGGGGRGMGGRNDSVRAQAEQHRVRHQQCCPLHHRHHATPPAAAVSIAQQPAPKPAAAVGQVKMRTELLMHVGEKLDNRTWTVVRAIADGGFGQVFEGVDVDGGRVAIKVEAGHARLPLLRHEYDMFVRLRQHFGNGNTPCHLIDIYGFGQTTDTGVDVDGGRVAIKVEAGHARLPLLRHEYDMFVRLRQHFGNGNTPCHLIDIYGFGQTTDTGVDVDGGRVAIKVEAGHARLPLLRHEYDMFVRLRQHFGNGNTPCHLIDIYGFGQTTDTGSTYLVMSLCGENLRQLKKATPDDRFSVVTTLLLTIQMIQAVQQLHNAGWIHRDVKPSNFCFGKPNHPRTVCMIDFGLARKYTTSDGRHRPARSYSGFHGTPRYASLATHDHQDMGRRDDMWSIFYITVENMVGQVPWRNIVDKMDVRRRKASANFTALLSGCDREGVSVIRFGQYITELHFEAQPDYNGLNSIFRNELEEMGVPQPVEDALYDWET